MIPSGGTPTTVPHTNGGNLLQVINLSGGGIIGVFWFGKKRTELRFGSYKTQKSRLFSLDLFLSVEWNGRSRPKLWKKEASETGDDDVDT